MSEVIPFPKTSKISPKDLNNIKVAVEKAVIAHHVLSGYVEEICQDSRLSHLGRDELVEIIAAMLEQQQTER